MQYLVYVKASEDIKSVDVTPNCDLPELSSDDEELDIDIEKLTITVNYLMKSRILMHFTQRIVYYSVQ